MSHKTEEILLIALFATLGGLFGSLYWLYSQTPAAMPQMASLAPTPTTRRVQGHAKLKLLGDTFSGYSLLREAEFQRALAAADIELTYENELDQVVRSHQLSDGKADLIITTLDQYLQQQPEGKIIGLVSQSAGADALVLNTPAYPDLNSLSDLQRLIRQANDIEFLEFGFAGDSPSEFMLSALNTKFPQLSLDELKAQRYADSSEVWQFLQSTSHDPVAVMLREPYLTRAINRGYRVGVTSQNMPQPIISVIVASDKVLASKPEVVSVFLEVYYRHIDDSVRDAAKMQALVARDGSMTDEEGASVLDRLDFFTALEAQRWFQEGILAAQVEATSAILAVNGNLDQVPRSMDTLVYADAINRAAQNTQALVDLVREDNPQLAARFAGQGDTLQVNF